MTRQVYEVIFAWTEMAEAIATKAVGGDERAERVLWMMETTTLRWLDDPARSCCLLCERTALLDNWHLVGGLFDDNDDLHFTFYVCDDCGPPLKMNLMATIRDKMARVMHADVRLIHGVGRNGEGHA
jgi:hypothetical protein